MKRLLLRSKSFARAARRTIRKNPQLVPDLGAVLEMLADDAFHPALRTHKLKGRLEGTWACSAGYDLRVLFRFVQHEGAEAVLLLTVGGHEEVY